VQFAAPGRTRRLTLELGNTFHEGGICVGQRVNALREHTVLVCEGLKMPQYSVERLGVGAGCS